VRTDPRQLVQGEVIWEGEAPAEPILARKTRLGGSLALPNEPNDFALPAGGVKARLRETFDEGNQAHC
jgi:hypothetical protein